MPEFRVRVEFDVETTNPSHIDAAFAAAEWLQERADEGRLDHLVYSTAAHADLGDGNGTQFVETDLDDIVTDAGGEHFTIDETQAAYEEPAPFNIGDTCCGKCPGGTCYVDQITGA